MSEALITYDEAERLSQGHQERQKRRTLSLTIVSMLLAVAITATLVIIVALSDSRVGLEALLPFLETTEVRPLQFD